MAEATMDGKDYGDFNQSQLMEYLSDNLNRVPSQYKQDKGFLVSASSAVSSASSAEPDPFCSAE